MENNKKTPQLCDRRDCTGCMACLNSCRQGALISSKDEEGFYRPILDSTKCIKCGLCEESCPVLNPPTRNELGKIKVYAAWHLDEDIRRNSSSGGAFTAFAQTVLKDGGVVVGAAYTSNMKIEHVLVSDLQGLAKLRLSKYAQSSIGNVLRQVRDVLKEGRKVLFVGTACQSMGLRSFLHRNYENLTCVDIICHGVPSIDFLQAYLNWIENKTGKVTHINFRDKQKGWYDNLRVITNTSGVTKVMKGGNDAYWVAFNRNNCLQECCYKCKAQGFPRCSDITLADFWRIGHRFPFGHKDEIEKGISMIIVNNPLSQKLVDSAGSKMYLEERTIEESIDGNQSGVKSKTRPQTRDSFYKDLKISSFEQCRVKYMKPCLKENLVKMFRERLPFFIIKYIRLQKQR